VNRRGELERAISRARIGAAPYALFTQLLRRSGNDTGEIPDNRYSPRLETLADQAKMARSTAFDALAELAMHGWFRRHATTDRQKVAGTLMAGRDCDCAGHAASACQRCGRPLTGKRRDARYCSHRCQMAARRRNPVQRAVTPSPAKPSQQSGKAVTGSPASRHNSQVTAVQAGNTHVESAPRGREKRVKPEPSVPEAVKWTAEQIEAGRRFAEIMEASGSDPWR
jgi:hypothetical protein